MKLSSFHPYFHPHSPSPSATGVALRQAGLSLPQIDLLDLYSCFPSAVQVAQRELGLSQDDPRPLTVTGGLPFNGGPFNNYVMHAIATGTPSPPITVLYFMF